MNIQRPAVERGKYFTPLSLTEPEPAEIKIASREEYECNFIHAGHSVYVKGLFHIAVRLFEFQNPDCISLSGKFYVDCVVNM